MLGNNSCDGLPVDAGTADAAVGGKSKLGIPGKLLGTGLVAADMTLNLLVQSSLGVSQFQDPTSVQEKLGSSSLDALV